MTFNRSLLGKGLVLLVPVSLLGLASAGDDALLIAALLVAIQQTYGSRGLTQVRQRRSFKSLSAEYGSYFNRAYRMSRPSFDKLCNMLQLSSSSRGPNGGIDGRLKLSCALRYMAGGDPLDIMIGHGLSHSTIFDCIWQAVDAINNCHGLDTLTYPSSHEEQKRIAYGFQLKSIVGFDNCGGAIDGILIETEKPSKLTCALCGCDSAKFYCGRKHRHGLNMQAVCDVERKFLACQLWNSYVVPQSPPHRRNHGKISMKFLPEFGVRSAR